MKNQHKIIIFSFFKLLFCRKLTTQKAYTPPANVEEVVREVVQEFKPGEDWKKVELKDHKVKFNVSLFDFVCLFEKRKN